MGYRHLAALFLIALAACTRQVGDAPMPPHPPPLGENPFFAWTAAKNAGWKLLHRTNYCIRLPEGIEAICLTGKRVDRCKFQFSSREGANFSLTLVPPQLAMASPEEFILPDGSKAAESDVQESLIGGEPVWDVRITDSVAGQYREAHLAPRGLPFWILVQYENLSAEEALVADRAIATILMPGYGPPDDPCPRGKAR